MARSCTLSNSSSFPHTGSELQTNCDGVDFNVTGNQGCVIEEPAQNSVGQNFAGGAYAMYWSTNGIQIWFFPVSSPFYYRVSWNSLIGVLDILHPKRLTKQLARPDFLAHAERFIPSRVLRPEHLFCSARDHL